LNDFFLDVIRAGFAFPVIEHFGEATNDGIVTVSVFMFQTEKFA
jgi:hypothetical protein